MPPLTDTAIKQAKPRDKQYKLSDTLGLFMIVSPSGGKWWRFKYIFNGAAKTISFGTYPDVSLKTARRLRDEARESVAAGINPSAERKRKKQEAIEKELADSLTFEKVANEWFEKQTHSLSSKYLEKVVAQIKKYAFPAFGSKNVAEIDRQDILATARRIEGTGAIESAHRFIQRVGQILRYSINAGYSKYDVTVGLQEAIARPEERHRTFTTDKTRIGQLLLAIQSYGGYPQTKAALSLATMLMVRPGELSRAEWNEIDWETKEWHIPAEKMKMRRKHIVPLCRQALSILEDLKAITGTGQFLFPSPKSDKKPISVESLTVALRSMGFPREQVQVHGFRAMASTILNEQGYNRDWIERQLAHIGGDKIRQTYNYAEYLPDRHRMMQEWADYLDSLRAMQEK